LGKFIPSGGPFGEIHSLRGPPWGNWSADEHLGHRLRQGSNPALVTTVELALRLDDVKTGVMTKTCPFCGVNPALLTTELRLRAGSIGVRSIAGRFGACVACSSEHEQREKRRRVAFIGFWGAPALASLLGSTIAPRPSLWFAFVGLIVGAAGAVLIHRKTSTGFQASRIGTSDNRLVLRVPESFDRILRAEAPHALWSADDDQINHSGM
jgi:hypothetical protein